MFSMYSVPLVLYIVWRYRTVTDKITAKPKIHLK